MISMRGYFGGLFSYLFSSLKISGQGLQAIWAETVFKAVSHPNLIDMQQPMMDHLEHLKLPEEILKKINNTEHEINEAREKIMESIDPHRGVELNNTLLETQQRIVGALNKNCRLTFYPNSFVTPTIFVSISGVMLLKSQQYKSKKGYAIVQPRLAKVITVGKQGISKSMGYIFAWYLSSVICRYRYQNFIQAKQLIKESLLDPNFRKIFYFSFNEKDLNYNKCIDLLKAQCPQIDNQITQQLQRRKNLVGQQRLEAVIDKITNLYLDKKIHRLLVYDQINALARVYTQYNSIPRSDIQTKRSQFQLTNNMKRLQLTMNKLGPAFIFNSSSNIEENLLGRPNRDIQFTLFLNQHTPINQVNCQFQKKIFQKVCRLKQIYRIIWYELQKKLGFTLNQKQYKEIIDHCDEMAKKNQFVSTITPLSLRLQINKNSVDLNEFTGTKDIQRIKNYINTIIIESKEAGMALLNTKIQNFFLNNNEQLLQTKMELSFKCLQLHYIYMRKKANIASIKSQSSSTNKQQTNYTEQEQEQEQEQQDFIIKQQQFIAYGIKWQKICSYINKHLFLPAKSKKGQNCLKLIISNQQLIQLDLVKLILDADKVGIINRLIKPNSDRVLMGKFAEELLLRYVKNKINLLFQVKKKSFNVKDISTFRHIFIKKNNQVSQEKNLIPKDIFEYFKSICQQAKKNEAGYVFGFPITKQKKTSPNSPSMDFLLVKYQSEQQGYHFTSFDVSVSKQKAQVADKLSKATILISQVLQKIQLIQQAERSNICLKEAAANKEGKQKFRMKINKWEHWVISNYESQGFLKLKKLNSQYNSKRVYLKMARLQQINLIPVQTLENEQAKIAKQNFKLLVHISNA